MKKLFKRHIFVVTLSAALSCFSFCNPTTHAADTGCSHAVLDTSGNCTTCSATGLDVCTLTSNNTTTPYSSLQDACDAAIKGDTISLNADCYDPAITLTTTRSSYNDLTIELNHHTLTLNRIISQAPLTIQNGSYTGQIDNPNIGHTDRLTLNNVHVTSPFLQWMTNGGVILYNSSLTLDNASQIWFEKLVMDESSIISITNSSSGIKNYGKLTTKEALSSITGFLPKGYSIGSISDPSMDPANTVFDEKGNIATNFVLTYKTLDGADITLNPESFVYSGSECKPSVSVSYEGTPLVVNEDYTYTFKNNINAGTAEIVLTGQGVYHGIFSKTFIIQKAARKAPTGLTTVSESVIGSKNGIIANVDTTMEYSTDNINWIKVTDTKITGLSSGVYYVRYAETDNYLASDATQITVGVTKIAANESVPKTADASHTILWFLIVATSISVIIKCKRYKK